MQYKCGVCGYIYDEDGINPTTGEINVPWDELPEDWVCPKCGAPKSEFKAVEDVGDVEEDFIDDQDFDETDFDNL